VLSWNLFAPMPFGWFLITGLISPLLAAVLLFLMPDLPASRAKRPPFLALSSDRQLLRSFCDYGPVTLRCRGTVPYPSR
jgi:hypothetical protein